MRGAVQSRAVSHLVGDVARGLGEHLVAALAARVGGARLEAEDGVEHHNRVVLRRAHEM